MEVEINKEDFKEEIRKFLETLQGKNPFYFYAKFFLTSSNDLFGNLFIRLTAEQKNVIFDDYKDYSDNIRDNIINPPYTEVFSRGGYWQVIKRPKCKYLHFRIEEIPLDELYKKIEKEILEQVEKVTPLLRALSDNPLPFEDFYYFENGRLHKTSSLSLLDVNFERKSERVIEFNKKIKGLFSRFFLKRMITSSQPKEIRCMYLRDSYPLCERESLVLPEYIDDSIMTKKDLKEFKELLFKYFEKVFYEWVCFYKIKKEESPF